MHMFIRSFFAVALSVGASAAVAQSSGVPAELPPVGFTGAQFVDSSGCVFSRVGVDDAVRWVPRVNPAREQICGRAPTFAAQPVTPPAAPPVVAGGAEVVIVVPQITTPPSDPVPEPETVAAAPAAPASAPATPAVATRVPVRKAPVPVTPRQVAPSLAGTVVRPATAAAQGIPLTARVLPRHVYEERLDFRPVVVPKGYRKAWDDGRLNPRRAEQTLQGHTDMRSIWRRGVPMHLQER